MVENILIRLQIKIDGLKVNQNDFINYFLILDHKLKERKVSLFPESENLPIAEKIQSTKNIYLYILIYI